MSHYLEALFDVILVGACLELYALAERALEAETQEFLCGCICLLCDPEVHFYGLQLVAEVVPVDLCDLTGARLVEVDVEVGVVLVYSENMLFSFVEKSQKYGILSIRKRDILRCNHPRDMDDIKNKRIEGLVVGEVQNNHIFFALDILGKNDHKLVIALYLKDLHRI